MPDTHETQPDATGIQPPNEPPIHEQLAVVAHYLASLSPPGMHAHLAEIVSRAALKLTPHQPPKYPTAAAIRSATNAELRSLALVRSAHCQQTGCPLSARTNQIVVAVAGRLPLDLDADPGG